jgi:hypothetical protein
MLDMFTYITFFYVRVNEVILFGLETREFIERSLLYYSGML